MYGIVKYISGAVNETVQPSGVMWFGSRELAEQYYGWQKMSGQFPIGEWSTDDYGREAMVDVLHYDQIMSPEFEIQGKMRLPYATQLVKDLDQLRGGVIVSNPGEPVTTS